jgi:hypothetical protein
MDQFSLYGPSPDEVTYASPQLTAQFLARALAAQNPAPVPAVFVRNWLRLLLRRGERYAVCAQLCEDWLHIHDPGQGKRPPRKPGRWPPRPDQSASAKAPGTIPPATGNDSGLFAQPMDANTRGTHDRAPKIRS